MTPFTDDLVDHSEHCRRCGGAGGHREGTGYGTTIFEPCDLCRGSGRQTIRIDPPAKERAA